MLSASMHRTVCFARRQSLCLVVHKTVSGGKNSVAKRCLTTATHVDVENVQNANENANATNKLTFDTTPLGSQGKHLLDGLDVYSVPSEQDGLAAIGEYARDNDIILLCVCSEFELILLQKDIRQLLVEQTKYSLTSSTSQILFSQNPYK